MKPISRAVLSVLCLTVLTWNGAKADEWLDHLCTYFDIIDVDKNLVATITDYIMLWTRVPLTEGNIGTLLRDLTRQGDIAIQFLNVFPLTDKDILANVLGGGVTLDEFIQSMTSKRYGDTLKTQVRNLVKFLASVSNYDGDETTMTPREFGIIYNVFQIDNSAADNSFKALDADNDGSLTLDEGIDAAQKYFNEAPMDNSRFFAGPVRSCDTVRKNKPTSLTSILSLIG